MGRDTYIYSHIQTDGQTDIEVGTERSFNTKTV